MLEEPLRKANADLVGVLTDCGEVGGPQALGVDKGHLLRAADALVAEEVVDAGAEGGAGGGAGAGELETGGEGDGVLDRQRAAADGGGDGGVRRITHLHDPSALRRPVAAEVAP